MSLNIADNFSYLGGKPLDSRLVFDTMSDMVSIPDSQLYEGIISFNKETGIFYTFKSSNTVNSITGKWRELSTTSGQTNVAEAQEYQEDTEYQANALVFLGDKICRVEATYTSANLGDVQDSFDDDIKTSKLSLINTDHAHVIHPYYQLGFYEKDHLVYFNNYIFLVKQNFTANGTEPTVEESLDRDVAAGKIVLLNKESYPDVIPYQQDMFYSKDKIVFTSSRLGHVVNDYVSDNTESSVDDSFQKDISDGYLIEMADEYRFKLWETTDVMERVIGDLTVLNVASSIVFGPNEDITDMKVHDCVYGHKGTMAIIESIDRNLGEITVKTINSRKDLCMPPAPNVYEYTINIPGSGFSLGEIVPTDMPGVNVEVDGVDGSGGITHVIPTYETITNANGVGQNISATIVFYVGNGQEWFEMPLPANESLVKAYSSGESYIKDSLIYFNNVLAVATQDFQATNTCATESECFNLDLQNGYLVRMTPEDVSVPECLGSVKEETDLSTIVRPVKGNWLLIEDCNTTEPGQAGIGLYDGSSWSTLPIPKGDFTFPEPNDDGSLYFRSRQPGDTSGAWEKFVSVNGNDIKLTIRSESNQNYLPEVNELVYDTSRDIIVIGDGSTTIGLLDAFYDTTLTNAKIVSALGYTPEDVANKGQANGYAPLGSDGLVPTQHLPAALTDVYTKSEIDTKHTNLTNSVTTLVNTEASRAKAAEKQVADDLQDHIDNTVIHVTQTDKDSWDAKVESSDLDDFKNHIDDNVIHVTQSDKDRWDGSQKAYYVLNKTDLPSTNLQIGNIGYVQISAAGVTPVVLDQYIWDGSAWKQIDASHVSLDMKWGNIQDRPAATPLTLDNTVTVAHSHNNKIALDKIGQSPTGHFTYDGVEIGIKAVFMDTELFLPAAGEENTLYVVYKDSRTRNYPSISVYKDGAYQILGRGAQESAPVVGDMQILQAEFYSVSANSSYNITFSPNQYFCFMPMEILKEIEGLKNQTRVACAVNDPDNFVYNENILSITYGNKLTIQIQPIDATLDTVSNYYYYHCDVDMSEYKDIDSIE